MNHLLIDYENIQPTDLSWVDVSSYHVWLFLGVYQQKHLPLHLIEFLLSLPREQVHLIKMQNTGKNSLDFCLSFHVGRIVEREPDAVIKVLSDDCDYDALLKHLKTNIPSLKISRIGRRSLSNHKAPSNKKAGKNEIKDEIALKAYQIAASRISKQEKARPRQLTSLRNFLRSHLQAINANSDIIEIVVETLVERRVITIAPSNKITYLDSKA